jgi:7-cyano-7-deazaguanine reductase
MSLNYDIITNIAHFKKHGLKDTDMNAKAQKKVPTTLTKAKQPSRSQELEGFKLGEDKTKYPQTYTPGLLEAFENKNPANEAWTTFICTEFTSLCPKTGQPDFAKIFINYVADKKMVESKSLKLYLFSFRNHGDFHEDCVQKICNELVKLMKPKFIEVIGEFTPRGGVSIFPYVSASNTQSRFKRLKDERFTHYSPGKYSVELARVYS